jgi:nicotinamide-nucleotide amidase
MSGIRQPEATVLSVGEELLQGRIADTNAREMALELLRLGFVVRRFLTVGDAPGDLQHALRELDGAASVLVSTGGLGPTADDRVRAETAAYAGVALTEVPGAVPALTELFLRNLRHEAPKPYLAQGFVPAGARPVANSAGTAWAFWLDLPRGTRYLALPGPPTECRAAFHAGGGGAALAERARGAAGVAFRAFHTAGAPESVVEARLQELLADSQNPRYGITANARGVTVSALAFASEGGPPPERLLEEADATLRARLGELLWGRDDETLPSVVVRALAARGATVTVAESCTGGRLAAALTSVPGASQVFHGGWICYANASKTRELGVSAETLARHGAVSEEVAIAMAAGARARAGADWALAVTGIAGPDGGSEEKPVGLAWIGVAGPDGVWAVRRRQWARGGRSSVQQQCVRDALDALRRELGGQPRLAPRP